MIKEILTGNIERFDEEKWGFTPEDNTGSLCADILGDLILSKLPIGKNQKYTITIEVE